MLKLQKIHLNQLLLIQKFRKRWRMKTILKLFKKREKKLLQVSEDLNSGYRKDTEISQQTISCSLSMNKWRRR